MHTAFHGIVRLNEGYTVSVPRTKLNVLVMLTMVLAGEVTDLYPSRGYTHPVTGAIEVPHTQLAKPSFDQKLFGRSHS